MNNYNTAPVGLKEIPLSEWHHGFFMYCLKKYESRQVYDHGFMKEHYDLRMFELDYNLPQYEHPLGFAIKRSYVNSKALISFCRFGTDEDWKVFQMGFASQFAGDNS